MTQRIVEVLQSAPENNFKNYRRNIDATRDGPIGVRLINKQVFFIKAPKFSSKSEKLFGDRIESAFLIARILAYTGNSSLCVGGNDSAVTERYYQFLIEDNALIQSFYDKCRQPTWQKTYETILAEASRALRRAIRAKNNGGSGIVWGTESDANMQRRLDLRRNKDVAFVTIREGNDSVVYEIAEDTPMFMEILREMCHTGLYPFSYEDRQSFRSRFPSMAPFWLQYIKRVPDNSKDFDRCRSDLRSDFLGRKPVFKHISEESAAYKEIMWKKIREENLQRFFPEYEPNSQSWCAIQ